MGVAGEIPGDGSTPTMSFGVEGAGQAGRLRALTIAGDFASDPHQASAQAVAR